MTYSDAVIAHNGRGDLVCGKWRTDKFYI